MGWKEDIDGWVNDILSTSFDERDGRVVPDSADVSNTEAVKLEAVFLYADLAQSSQLAQSCPWDTTAKIIRSYLYCATRLIRAYGGEVRSFDGDRVMGVFIGDQKNTHAARCGREIFYCTDQVIAPKASKKFKSVSDADIKVKCCVWIDRSVSRAVRAGIRDNNDLIWIGRAPSLAAKLSDVREYPFCVYIHKDVFNALPEGDQKSGEDSIWEKRSLKVAGADHDVYRTKYYRLP